MIVYLNTPDKGQVRLGSSKMTTPEQELIAVQDTETRRWDILDQEEDTPTHTEEEFKAILTSHGFACARGGSGVSGEYVIYQVVPNGT